MPRDLKRGNAVRQNQSKMVLTLAEAAEAQKAHGAAVGELLDPTKPKDNVVGVGVGVK